MSKRFFVGDIDEDWSTSGNWAIRSGGRGGAGVPGPNDDVIFDANSYDCIAGPNAGVNIKSLSLDFDGTLYILGDLTFSERPRKEVRDG